MFAFHFNHPSALWGLALCLAPALIYWLLEPPKRQIPWAAIRFLERAHGKTRLRSRLWDWMLVFVQTLILACVALACAAPSGENFRLNFAENSNLVILFDNSASMRALIPSERQTRFEVAKRCVLALTSEKKSPRVISLCNPEMGTLEEIQTSEEAPDWGKLKKLVQDNPQLVSANCTFLLVSDGNFPGKDWDDFRNSIQNRCPNVRFEFLSVYENVHDLAVSQLRLAHYPAVARQQNHVYATIYNVSAMLAENVCIRTSLLIHATGETRQLAETWVSVPAGSSREVACPFVPDSSGNFQIIAQIVSESGIADDWEEDDTRQLDVTALPCARVLIVETWNTGNSEKRTESSSFYLTAALRAIADARETPGSTPAEPPQIDVLCDESIDGITLSDYDLAIFADVPQLRDSEISSLKTWLSTGGALVCFAGDTKNVTEKYDFISNITQVNVLNSVVSPENQAWHPIFTKDAEIFAALGTEGKKAVESVPVYAFRKCVPKSGSRVPLELSTSPPSPLLVVGKPDNVALFTISADAAGSAFPLLQAYAPLLDTVFQHVSRASASRTTREVGPSESEIARLNESMDIATSDFTAFSEVLQTDGRTVFPAAQALLSLAALLLVFEIIARRFRGRIIR